MSLSTEKLETIIEEQEEKINDLEETIEYHERCINWQVHRIVDENKMDQQYPGYNRLPLPRLEMRVNPLREDWYTIEWLYGIVYKHYTDDIIFVPIGHTTGNGANFTKMKTGEVEFPYRDGLHIRTEMKLFNLRGYILCNGRIEEIAYSPFTQETFDESMKNMKRN